MEQPAKAPPRTPPFQAVLPIDGSASVELGKIVSETKNIAMNEELTASGPAFTVPSTGGTNPQPQTNQESGEEIVPTEVQKAVALVSEHLQRLMHSRGDEL